MPRLALSPHAAKSRCIFEHAPRPEGPGRSRPPAFGNRGAHRDRYKFTSGHLSPSAPSGGAWAYRFTCLKRDGHRRQDAVPDSDVLTAVPGSVTFTVDVLAKLTK